MKKQTPQKDLYQQITDQILEALEQGVMPWQKPWTLLHIPGEVIIGNTIINEVNYHLYTPAHILGNWNKKLGDAASYTEAEYQVIKPEPVEETPLEIDWENEPMFY